MMSVETQDSIVKDTQIRQDENGYKTFLKTLIDEIPIVDIKDKSLFIQDLKDCLDITLSDSPEGYHSLDTAVRDYFINAYMKSNM